MQQTHVLIAVAIFIANGAVVEAQLFGNRQFGQPFQKRVGRSMFRQAGDVQGTERFLRGNRGATNFLGADQRERRGLVGSEQASSHGAALRSTAGLQERTDQSSRINQPLLLSDSEEMYHPTLQLVFSTPQPPLVDVGNRLTKELSQSLRFSEQCHFEVSVVERTAILRGEVTSAKERDLAELVALVEPGISAVKNELYLVPLDLQRNHPIPPPSVSPANDPR